MARILKSPTDGDLPRHQEKRTQIIILGDYISRQCKAKRIKLSNFKLNMVVLNLIQKLGSSGA